MGAPTGWVYRVALNDLRRRQRRRRREGVLHRRRPAPADARPRGRPRPVAAVAELPLRQREAVVLRYVADLREREVADVMGISEGAASAALSAARRSRSPPGVTAIPEEELDDVSR